MIHKSSHRGNSGIAKVIRLAVQNNPEWEPHHDPCRGNPLVGCTMAKGLEGLFVADIARRVHSALVESGNDWGFHQCVYMPSTRIERKCGFDISIGHYDPPGRSRVRLMHKLQRSWNDQSWTWSTSKELNPDKSFRCIGHIGNLLSQNEATNGRIMPFLSFSVCFCLHEYRRMGTADVPSFEDPQRTGFINLSALKDFVFSDVANDERQGHLVISHTVGNNPTANWVDADRRSSPIKVLSWEEFLYSVIPHLTQNENHK